MQRYKDINITISQKKLELVGHIISDKGYGPDNEKYKDIPEFPKPKNLRDQRGLIGLVNQLGIFIPDLAHMTSPLLPLMKKESAWEWLQEHDAAFSKIKELLTSTSMVKPCNQTKKMLMLTDASRLYGLGFALIQKTPDGQSISLIQFGSCSLSETPVSYTHLTLPTTPYV